MELREWLQRRLRDGSFSLLVLLCSIVAEAQGTGGLHGQVLDPSGAVIPGAAVTATQGGKVFTIKSGQDGTYIFPNLAAGIYTLMVEARGFARLERTNVVVVSGQIRRLNVSLSIAVEQQNVEVTAQNIGVSVNPDENAGAIVLRGSDLDALSDDPDQLQNELQALAGPTAGPSGGQIYIDGFEGGQLPPKSSIREIRVNQNPFSAEFGRIGYGRIEILTKPGSDKFAGHIGGNGSSSAFNTANPLVQQQPDYYYVFGSADMTAPLKKHASMFFNVFGLERQNQSMVVAVDPKDTESQIQQALPNPSSYLYINPRVDMQLGKSNTLTIRESTTRSVQTGAGTGGLNLAEQAFHSNSLTNGIQIGDTVVVNSHLINETRFIWTRIRYEQTPSFVTPTVTVQGAFTTGGNNSSVVQDHQDVFDVQNYTTATAGLHTMRFGMQLHGIRDANYSTSGANGSYVFQSLDHYMAQKPDLYRVTVVNNPLARTFLHNESFFFQDDWRYKPNLTISLGLRFETQNWISDRADWGPRVALAWAPGHMGKTPPKTVLRAGYGWFYDRFSVPTSFAAANGTPYVIQTIHQNGVNQQSYVIRNPNFYDPTTTIVPGSGTSSKTPNFYTIDPLFRAALEYAGRSGGRSAGRQGDSEWNLSLHSRGPSVSDQQCNRTGVRSVDVYDHGDDSRCLQLPVPVSGRVQPAAGDCDRESAAATSFSDQ